MCELFIWLNPLFLLLLVSEHGKWKCKKQKYTILQVVFNMLDRSLITISDINLLSALARRVGR